MAPSLNLVGLTLNSVRGSGPVMVVDFSGDRHLIFTPERDARGKPSMRATVVEGQLPGHFGLCQELLPEEARAVYGRLILVEAYEQREFGPSLVLGFDDGYTMVIPLGGGPVNVELNGALLGPRVN